VKIIKLPCSIIMSGGSLYIGIFRSNKHMYLLASGVTVKLVRAQYNKGSVIRCRRENKYNPPNYNPGHLHRHYGCIHTALNSKEYKFMKASGHEFYIGTRSSYSLTIKLRTYCDRFHIEKSVLSKIIRQLYRNWLRMLQNV
jgi:hypothetical protein